MLARRLANDPVFERQMMSDMKGKKIACFCKNKHKEIACHLDNYAREYQLRVDSGWFNK